MELFLEYYESTEIYKNENKFYYKNSPDLKKFVSLVIASSIINLPLCIIGPSGIGKTSLASEVSKMKSHIYKLNKDYFYNNFI